ncbi:tRNA 5-methylaminomethyl-2-thiouridine synthase TusD [Vibrio sp. JCM 19053]|nr:tRNA 5-methylaminomethyl-2-thiouridine synthase TusD [Vibrio sp. JCM 19053]
MKGEQTDLHVSGEWSRLWQPVSAQCLSVRQSVIEQGHQLVSVFFYQDGVTNGTALSVPANDEFDLNKAWQFLAKEHGVRLETCVAAALRRGIVSEEEANQHGLVQNNLADGFEQAGLGSLAEAMLTQDRVVQF